MKTEELYILQHLDRDSLELLNKKITKSKVKKNSIIFYQAQSSHQLHILVSGRVKIYKHTPNGEEIIIHSLKAQSLIAEMATFEQVPYPASCMAESEAQIWKIKREDFLDILSKEPRISLEIIASMSAKIKDLEQSIELNISKSATQRVAFIMLQKAHYFQEFSRVKIAAILNISPETLSRIIRIFKDDGLIYFDKKVLIIENRAALLELS